MISEVEVRHVANLARLGLTDDEVEKMSGQLGAILDSIDQIGERPDEPHMCLSPEEALSTAPDAGDDLFAVPRID